MMSKLIIANVYVKNIYTFFFFSSKQIKEEGKINSDVLRVLPYYFKKNRPLIYWRSQVEAAHQEYVNHDRKDIWLYEKLIQLENLNKIASGCAGPTQTELLKKKQIVNKLKMLISKLSLVVPNDANRAQRQVEVELKRCDIYKKYDTNNHAIKLFNENHWDLFQNLIRQEYEEKREYAALRAKQFDIFYKVSKIEIINFIHLPNHIMTTFLPIGLFNDSRKIFDE